MHNAEKYKILSHDNVDMFFHTPHKTLLYVIHIPDNNALLGATAQEYMDYYAQCQAPIVLSSEQYGTFRSSIIINDYETFIDKVYHCIMAM